MPKTRHTTQPVTSMRSIDSTGLSKRLKTQLRRYHGELPIIDAIAPLQLFPSKDDVACAIKGDHMECAIAQCAKRVCGSTAVIIDRTVAYVDHFDEDGKRRIHRYTMTKKTQKAIAGFDQGLGFPAAGFTLAVPTGSNTLDAQLERSRTQYERDRKKKAKALMNGTIVEKRERKDPLAGLVRNGSGLHQMHVVTA